MKNDELSALLHAAQQSAVGAADTSISQQRADLTDRFNAERYGDEIADRSTYVDTTVRNSVLGVMPEILEIFFGADKVVEFTPREQSDVDAAEQETEVVNHVLMQMNGGYKVFSDWFFDALLHKNGYVKRYWDDTLGDGEVEEYADLTDEERFAVLDQAVRRGEVEMLEESVGEDGTHDFKIKITLDEPHRYRIESVPPEEIYVSSNWSKLDFEDCPFVAHRRAMSVSDLIAMGFSRKQVEELPTVDPLLDNEEKTVRFTGRFGEEYEGRANDIQNTSQRQVMVYENYVRVDRDNDGIAELLQVYTGGDHGEILKRKGGALAIEEVDAIPFNVICPLPIPHKHYGLSMADQVTDIQRVRTVLTRQMLDNMVMANNPETHVAEEAMTANTLEDLAVTQPGRVVRIRGGAASITNVPVQNVAANSLAALDFIKKEGEHRTGVTDLNQGLDADSLNKTYGGMKSLMSAAQKKLLMVARNFAETGVRQLFIDTHRDLRKGPMKKIAMRLRNDWVQVDPRTWADRADMTINVGLGTGDRDVQFERLGFILQQQKESLQMGFVEPRHLTHTLTKMLELSGFKDHQSFFPDASEMQMQPQQDQGPSPEELLAQVEMQKTQAKAQSDAAKLEADKAQDAMKAQIEAEKLLLEARKAETDAEIEKAKLELDVAKLELEREKAGLEARKLELEAVKTDASVRSSDHGIRKDHEAFEFKREELLGDLGQTLGPLIDQLRGEGVQSTQALGQALMETQAGLADMAAALGAPKTIIYDDEGRPAGVKTEYAGEANGEMIDAITRPKRLVRDADGNPTGVE